MFNPATRCETCGRWIPPSTRGVELAFQGRQIYLAVKKRPRSTEQLHQLLYADDPNGGANIKTIHVIVAQANRILKTRGVRLRAIRGIYYLVKVDEEVDHAPAL